MTSQSVTVHRDVLVAALAQVQLVVSRTKTQIPVVGMVHMVGEGDALRLTGTDLDRVVRTGVEAGARSDFPARCVPCHRLATVVAQLPPATVTITATKNGVRVSAGRATFDIVGLPADEFPSFPFDGSNKEASAPTVAEFEAAPFLAAMGRALTHVSGEMSRPTLNGVHLGAKQDGPVRIVGCDGTRLVREHVERASGPALDVILPSTSAAAALKLFGGASRLSVEWRGARARVTADGQGAGLSLETSLIAGPYPNVDQAIPRDIPHEASVDRLALLTAVRRVASLSSFGGYRVKLTWSADAVTIEGIGDTDAGTGEDVVSCDAPTIPASPPTRTLCNPRFLAAALAVRGADMVRVGIGNSRVITFRDEGAVELQNVVMTLRDIGQ